MVKCSLNSEGYFEIEDYNQAKVFSNFFPGIAGLWGIPMWVFFVNRGQGIASFGIESKDKAILEFQPANKAYRLTSLQGFRTFIKGKAAKKNFFWEPFQNSTQQYFKIKQTLKISAHDLTLEEINHDLGLNVRVNYFTIPEEPYAGLVRSLEISNLSRQSFDIEIIDGLPLIVPYGLTDWLNKNMTRTVEAWAAVKNLRKKAPYYQLKAEVSDEPQVKSIAEGNFYFSFDPQAKGKKILPAIIEAASVFGRAADFIFPEKFEKEDFKIPSVQMTSNRMPSAMSYWQGRLKPKIRQEIVSLFGFAHHEKELEEIVQKAIKPNFIKNKAARNKEIIAEIKNFTLTKSSSEAFDRYAGHTFLDNVLRGGLPISIQTKTGQVPLNVFSRKHGDLERDYNFFILSPAFYSQGNGNYRDVNQNRRSDIWFNQDVKDTLLINFLNLIQADGYNPLVVRGTEFIPEDIKTLEQMLIELCTINGRKSERTKRNIDFRNSIGKENVNKECFKDNDLKLLIDFIYKGFQPGALLKFMGEKRFTPKVSPEDFLARLLEICHAHEQADHGEGFWTDHWTYNLDLIESYLSLYPEDLRNLFLEKKVFSFYHNSRYVVPRELRYVLTQKGVRQYHAVSHGRDVVVDPREKKLRTKNGAGSIYYTNLLGKLLCVIANKAASLDPSGIGIEMEANKPDWYDALNGLPGLLGSSISETLELKRLVIFVLDALKEMGVSDGLKIPLFEELTAFIAGLTHILSLESEPHAYWAKANDAKEHYRLKIRNGIDGQEKEWTIKELQVFLNLVLARTDKAMLSAKNKKGELSTYFYHEVTKYDVSEKHQTENETYVRPLRFEKHPLPLFLEGYVHALRIASSKEEARGLYQEVRESDLFDPKLKMYKVNADLSEETEEIGRTRIFPRGWLENESIWLHMEYKFMLELLRAGLYEEFYENFPHVLIPFLKPETYGRSILENSSFLVSSVHEDAALHGQGFVARLSGSTAELISMWLLMNVGKKPFFLNAQKELVLSFSPALAGWLFTKEKSNLSYQNLKKEWQEVQLPKNIYAFMFLGSILTVYHNPRRANTFGPQALKVREIHLTYPNQKRPVVISSERLPPPYSDDVRHRRVARIDLFLK